MKSINITDIEIKRMSKNIKDLTGLKIGENGYIVGYAGSSKWYVKCDCGVIFIANTGNIKKNISGCWSCGVKRGGKNRSSKNNLIGKKFGKLIVITKIENTDSYLCQCSCYNITITTGSRLKSGMTKSCGCLKIEYGKSKLIDLTGKIFNNIEIISLTDIRTNKYHVMYFCKCNKCYNFCLMSGNSLTTGKSKTCGCSKRNTKNDINMINKTFGWLYVIERVESYKKKGGCNAKYRCLCECGTVCLKRGDALRGGVKSCGCANKGKNSHHYNPDLSDKERDSTKLRNMFSDTRKLIFKRDDYTCQKCYIKGGIMNVHHIYNWHSHEDLRDIHINLLTLCKKCHDNFHNKYGKKFNNLFQLEEYLGYQLKIREDLLKLSES